MKINIGDNIKYYRQINKLSQRELGEKLNVTFQTISSWEKNRTEPKMGHIEQMARIFGCNKSDLIYIENKDSVPKFVPGTTEIIDLYSRASEDQRQAVLNLLRSFVAHE